MTNRIRYVCTILCMLSVLSLGAAFATPQRDRGTLAISGAAQNTPLRTSFIKRLVNDELEANAQLGSSVAVSGDIAAVGAPQADSGGVNDAGAVSIFERNFKGTETWLNTKNISLAGPVAEDYFGFAVALSGDTLVVGAPGRAISGTLDQGAAYVYSRNQGGANEWGLVAELTAADGSAGAAFGTAVALSGDTLVVGANTAAGKGRAYVFYRNQGGADHWGQAAALNGSDTLSGDLFGTSVAISADIIVVGAPHAVQGDLLGAGAAYVFYRNQGGADSWGQLRKLIGLSAGENNFFGSSVALSGDTMVIGAPDASFDGIGTRGRAYVLYRNRDGADMWGLGGLLEAPDALPNDRFGSVVSISGDVVLIGAMNADVSGAVDQGKAYLFERNAGEPKLLARSVDVADQWDHVQTFSDSAGAGDDYFGMSVSVSGSRLIIGTPRGGSAGAALLYKRDADQWQHFGSPGTSGTTNDRFGSAIALDNDTLVVGADGVDGTGVDSGAAYIFERNQGGTDSWGLVKMLTAPDAAASDRFGQAVDIADDTIVIGAPGKNAGSGAVYVFERNQGSADGWGLRTTLNGGAGERHGYAVSLSANRIAAGSPALAAIGLVRVYERNQGGANSWGQIKQLSYGATGDQFGAAVDLDGERVLVGAPYADVTAAPTPDFQELSDPSIVTAVMTDSGMALIFAQNTGGINNWGLVKNLIPEDRSEGDHFGWSVALGPDIALVGAPDLDTSLGVDAGGVFRFSRNQGAADGWGMRGMFENSQGASSDRFGFAVALHGAMVAVGSPRVQVGTALNQGQVIIFERNVDGGDRWGELTRVQAEEGLAEDRFGYSVALGSTILAGGALRGDRDSVSDQGAVYLFAARSKSFSSAMPLIHCTCPPRDG